MKHKMLLWTLSLWGLFVLLSSGAVWAQVPTMMLSEEPETVEIPSLDFIYLRGEQETWIYTDEEYTFGVMLPEELQGKNAFVEYKAGIWQEDVLLVSFEDVCWIDGEQNLVIVGESLRDNEELAENDGFFSVKGFVYADAGKKNLIGETELINVELREPYYDYYYNIPKQMLPGWEQEVESVLGVYAEDKLRPFGADLTVKILDVAVEQNMGSAEQAVRVEEGKNHRGWKLIAEKNGCSTVYVTYETLDRKRVTESFEIEVKDKIYELRMTDLYGNWMTVPGGEEYVLVDPWVESCDSEGNYSSEPFYGGRIEWKYEEEDAGGEFAFKFDSKKRVIGIFSEEHDWDYDFTLTACLYLTDENGKEYLACEESSVISRRRSFYLFNPLDLEEDLLPGFSTEFYPELISFTSEEPEGVLCEDVFFTLDWDEASVAVYGEADERYMPEDLQRVPYNGHLYRVEKTENRDACLTILVEKQDELGEFHEIYNREHWFFQQDLSIWFENARAEDRTWMYMDETYTMTAVMSDYLENIGSKISCQAVFELANGKVLSCQKGLEYDVDSEGTISLYGQELAKNSVWKQDGTRLKIQAEAWIFGKKIAVYDLPVEFGSETVEYQFEYMKQEFFPGEELEISSDLGCIVSDANNPHGFMNWVKISDAKIENKNTDPAVSLEKNGDGTGWTVHMLHPGNETLIFTYKTIQGEMAQERVEIRVVDYKLRLMLDEDGVLTLSVPHMEKVTEQGILISNSEIDVDLDTTGRTRIVFTELDEGNEYTFDTFGLRGCVIRGYCVYEDEDGSRKIIYSESIIK